jgi:hypothetical protein
VVAVETDYILVDLDKLRQQHQQLSMLLEEAAAVLLALEHLEF